MVTVARMPRQKPSRRLPRRSIPPEQPPQPLVITLPGSFLRVAISYYEEDNAQPPGPMLLYLAKILKVTVDQLLGRDQVKAMMSPRAARLLNRLRRIEELSPAEQRIVLGTLEAVIARRRGAAAGARKSG